MVKGSILLWPASVPSEAHTLSEKFAIARKPLYCWF